MKKGLIKLFLLTVIAAFMAYNSSFGKMPQIHNYPCNDTFDLQITMHLDLNNDNHYETFTSVWCDLSAPGGSSTYTGPIAYPIQATVGIPANDVWVEDLPGTKILKPRKKKKPAFTEFIGNIGDPPLWSFDQNENNDTVFYTQFIPWTTSVDEPTSTSSEIKMTPNPATGNVSMYFELKSNNYINVSLLNYQGIEVQKIEDNYRPSGVQELKFDVSNLASGIYYVQMKVGTNILVSKLYVVK